ncbi:MAG: hypothetical protein RLZZ540_2339 [Bacteroidota bacterium]
MVNVPPALIKGLRSYLLLEFYDYPYLTVDISNSGSLFLNYYLSGKTEDFSHIITEISSERLDLLLSGEIDLKYSFENTENKIVYLANFNSKGEVFNLNMLDFLIFKEYNPIPLNYELDFEIEEKHKEVDLKIKSVQREKILVDVYLQANSLKSSLKYWALKNFLMPFSELVRTSLLNNSNQYTTHNLDRTINLGYNNLELASLSTTLEMNFNSDLFGNSQDLENLIHLFRVFNSTDEKEVIESFDNFSNKKIISEYLKILNVIIKNDACLKSKIAAPNDYFSEMFISKKEAQKIKQIINEKIPVIEDVEEIQGYLLELSFDKANPTFIMNASLEDFKYKGKINNDLVQKISEKEFTFISKEYIFKIHTLYVPETSKSIEQTTRTLIDIIDLNHTS